MDRNLSENGTQRYTVMVYIFISLPSVTCTNKKAEDEFRYFEVCITVEKMLTVTEDGG